MKKKTNEQGFTSIYVIILMTVLLPFVIFVFVTFSHMVQNTIYFKNLSDNAASSAVVCLNEQKLQDGIVFINEEEAIAKAKTVIANELNLNPDLTVNSNSKIKENPNITISVYNDVPEEGRVITTSLGKDIKIFKPSVVVVAEYPTLKITNVNATGTIKNIGVAGAEFLINR